MSAAVELKRPYTGLPSPDEVSTVACLMLGGIGDVLVATPTLAALRRRYPGARLTCIVRPECAALVQHDPAVDEVFPLHNATPAHKAAFLLRLKLRSWDLWVDLHVPTYNTVSDNGQLFRRNAWLMRTAGCRYRLGFNVDPLLQGLTHGRPVPSETVLQQENLVHTTLRLVSDDGADPTSECAVDGVQKRLFTREEDGALAQRLLDEAGVSPAPVGLFFGGKQASDLWPEENVYKFCEEVCASHPDMRFVLFGGRPELALARRLAQRIGSRVFPQIMDVTNRLSLLQTAALLRRCKALVTTDSGPMHMADALGVPAVALFSSKNYLPIWLPLTRPLEVLNEPVPCGPCLSSTCHNASLCMRSITPESVLRALERILEQTRED